MEKRQSNRFEPKVYLPDIRHPKYSTRGTDYFIEHNRKKLHKRFGRSFGLGLNEPRVLAAYYRQETETSKILSAQKDTLIVEAIKLFGDEPLELTVSLTPLRFCEDAERLAAAICYVLGWLTFEGLRGSYDERKKARSRLRKILKDLWPDARGKKKNTSDPFRVQLFYWNTLFRLYHIQNALRASDENQSQKVKAASQNFDTPIEQIRELWNLDEDDRPTARPIPIKEMARIVTARHFGITQHRLSNILAS